MASENDRLLKVHVGWIDLWYKVTPTQKALSARRILSSAPFTKWAKPFIESSQMATRL